MPMIYYVPIPVEPNSQNSIISICPYKCSLFPSDFNYQKLPYQSRHTFNSPNIADVINISYDDRKLVLCQVVKFAQELQKFKNQIKTDRPIPCILAGDFNSTPMSIAYELITKGKQELEKDESGNYAKPPDEYEYYTEEESKGIRNR